jgi:DNA-directed RNA polymerase specialized sigma24 family protein
MDRRVKDHEGETDGGFGWAVDHHGDAVTIVWSLERLLTTLKPSQSEVIRLVKLQGHSIEEVSKIRLVTLLRNQSHAD